MNLPIKLSLFRIVLTFIFLFFSTSSYFVYKLIALIIFIVASITDYYDGKIARETKQITDFGKFLDPLADKILISAAFISFVSHPEFHIPSWIVVIIISREFIITGLRNMLQTKGINMAADLPGKFKTTFQIIVIITLLIINAFDEYLYRFGISKMISNLPIILMYMTAILTIYSGISYFIKYKKIIENEIK